ncbi:hypothetical protein [Hymenobacter arcticus]
MRILSLLAPLRFQPAESDTAAVRAVFFIDPSHKIHLVLYYPMSVGCNLDELLRALQALQYVDEHHVSRPLNWQLGQKVLLPAPVTLAQLGARLADDSVEQPEFCLAETYI